MLLPRLRSVCRVLKRIDPKLSIWETEEKAILHKVKILETDWRRDYNNSGSYWAATGDDTWILLFVDAAYGTDFAEKHSTPLACGNKVKMPAGGMF
jgi:hypothetical protein